MAKSTSDLNSYVKDITRCVICLDYFDDPRSLPCLHTFCAKCVRCHCQDSCPGDDAQCPVCRKEFRLPADGVEGLPHNFFLADLVSVRMTSSIVKAKEVLCEGCGVETRNPATLRCLDCGEKLCAGCGARCRNRKAGPHEVVKLGEEPAELVRRRGDYCEQHTSNLLEMYCAECKIAICTVCFAVKHNGHRYLEISEVAGEFSKQIRDNIATLSSRVNDLKKNREDNVEIKKSFLDSVDKTVRCVVHQGEEVKRQIDLRVEELLRHIDTVKTATIKEFESFQENIDLALLALESFINYSQHVAERGTFAGISRFANDLNTRATELKMANTADGLYQAPHVSFEPVQLAELETLLGQVCVLSPNYCDQQESESSAASVPQTVAVVAPASPPSPVTRSTAKRVISESESKPQRATAADELKKSQRQPSKPKCSEARVWNDRVGKWVRCPSVRDCPRCGAWVSVKESLSCVQSCPSCKFHFCFLCLSASCPPHLKDGCANSVAPRQTTSPTQTPY